MSKRINVDVSDETYNKLKNFGRKLGGLPTTSIARFFLQKQISSFEEFEKIDSLTLEEINKASVNK